MMQMTCSRQNGGGGGGGAGTAGTTPPTSTRATRATTGSCSSTPGYRKSPVIIGRRGPGHKLVAPLVLISVAAAAVVPPLPSAAASAATPPPGFDYFSGGNLVSGSVSDYPPTFLDSVERALLDLAIRDYYETVSSSPDMIQSAFPSSSSAMPAPRRVADPTGVYGPQDSDSAEAIRHKTTESNMALGISQEAFPQFTAALTRPKNRTEGRIHSILMESLPSRGTKTRYV